MNEHFFLSIGKGQLSGLGDELDHRAVEFGELAKVLNDTNLFMTFFLSPFSLSHPQIFMSGNNQPLETPNNNFQAKLNEVKRLLSSSQIYINYKHV